jgi:hypothetical protein
MRRPVAAVVAALAVAVVLLVTGCGGGGTAETTKPAASAAAPPPPPAAVSAESVELSAEPITTPRPFPVVSDRNAPKAVIDALAAKRPFMLVFYDSKQTVTTDQKAVMDELAKKYRGLIEFIAFDLQTFYTAPADSFAKKNATLAAELAQKLEVGYEPAILIVDKEGRITWQSTGFYDAGTLEREILRATQ